MRTDEQKSSRGVYALCVELASKGRTGNGAHIGCEWLVWHVSKCEARDGERETGSLSSVRNAMSVWIGRLVGGRLRVPRGIAPRDAARSRRNTTIHQSVAPRRARASYITAT